MYVILSDIVEFCLSFWILHTWNQPSLFFYAPLYLWDSFMLSRVCNLSILLLYNIPVHGDLTTYQLIYSFYCWQEFVFSSEYCYQPHRHEHSSLCLLVHMAQDSQVDLPGWRVSHCTLGFSFSPGRYHHSFIAVEETGSERLSSSFNVTQLNSAGPRLLS